MLKRCPRWGWLVLFAAFNLVVWSAVAIGAGMLASDAVDLGIESRLRIVQATVVGALGQLSEKGEVKAPQATDLAQGQESLKTDDAPAFATAVTPGQLPGSTLPFATEVPGAVPSDTAALPPPATTPQPTEALVTSSLLLEDPGLASLTGLDPRSSHSAPGRQVEIRYDEAALNQELRQQMQENSGSQYRDVQVDLRRDLVVVTGYVTTLGIPVKVTVEGTVVAKDCLPQAEVQSVRVAGFLSSTFIQDYVRGEIDKAMRSYPADSPLCLQQIVLDEDRVTVYGYYR